MTRAVTDPAGFDDRLEYTDQAMFLGLRATGQEAVMQIVWIYERPVDLDNIRRFHDGIGYGLLGRRIERSVLPFGRHRWVSALGPQADLDFDEPRDRAELGRWIDERATMPLDPEHGPAWHVGVLPMTDGSTAVSIVISHCVSDGGGALQTMVNAIHGRRIDYGYPAPGARTRGQALREDLRVTLRGLPEVGRTLVEAVRQVTRRRDELTKSGGVKPQVEGPDQQVFTPSATVCVKLDDWDRRAAELGGNGHSLVAGFVAKLAQNIGRVGPDGMVTLNIPQGDRNPGDDDTRANAVVLVNLAIDPDKVTTDLAEARAALREGLRTAREVPDENLRLLPLTPFTPKRAVRKMADVAFGFSTELPVSCSNMGDVPPGLPDIDGTPADLVFLRGIDRVATRHALEQRCGLLTVVAGRINGTETLTFAAYAPGAENTTAWLRGELEKTLADFDLSGVIE
ncbi:wax ester/triacylglycerol synthase domain-containing protein [Mycobacterium sp. AMU20-3851]|uniref:wax ester/triacylglycerol synthase domain-containing protein n=1 Tax=Mycobacterium sp. AMU20-3851 TaxID=3122055 RepID=UPI00375475E9